MALRLSVVLHCYVVIAFLRRLSLSLASLVFPCPRCPMHTKKAPKTVSDLKRLSLLPLLPLLRLFLSLSYAAQQ